MKNAMWWMGDETSFQAYLDFVARCDALTATEMRDMNPWRESEEPDQPEDRGYMMADNVAIVRVSGPLVKDETFFSRLFGMASYTGIRNAVIRAAADDKVGSILLEMDSPGGPSNGLMDAAAAVNAVNKKMKPVVAYASGHMHSAAYLIGSTAREAFISPLGEMGSIGVMTVVMNYAEALKKEGVKAHVFRAGKFKAVLNSIEPVTPEIEEIVNAKLQALYSVFISHVAQHRGKSEQYVRDVMAEGREFVGVRAVDANLADGVQSLDETVQAMNRRFKSPAQRGPANTGLQARMDAGSTDLMEEGTMAKKKVLSAADVAAIQAGADPAAVGAAPEAGATATAIATATGGDPDAGTGTDNLNPEAGTGVVASATPAAPEAPELSSVQAFLTQITGLNERITALTVEGTQLRAELAAQTASLESLRAHVPALSQAVSDHTNVMLVALGAASIDMSGMSPEVILAEHAKVTAKFNATFKVGQQVDTRGNQGDSGDEPAVEKPVVSRSTVKFSK